MVIVSGGFLKNSLKFSFFFVLSFLLLASTAFAILSHNEAKIFAVTSDGKGLSADLYVDIEKGTGKSWVALDSLVGTSTQSTAKTSVQLAKNYFDKVDSYDYKFDINSNASLVEGPSAGAAMALLVISSLQGKKIPQNVSLTGTINSDGSVGAVGGVFEKAKEAARIKMALFMIPKGEARQIVKLESGIQTIDLIDYAAREWGMKVVEVQDIDAVLKFAFSDVSRIDVNRTANPLQPEFTPQPIKYAPQLDLMHSLTSDYIKRAEAKVSEAKISLNSTLLDDSEVLDALLSGLTASEKYLAESNLLLDQNYLYSSANYAFLAKINALLVKDIADNPSILSSDSTVFDLKLNSLKGQIEELKSKLNQGIPVEYLEWHIAARQRLAYAELNVKKLTSGNKTVIVTGDGSDETTAQLSLLHDFESAAAWVEIANDFYDISKNSTKFISPNDDVFSETAQNLAVDSENKLTVLTGEEFDDAQRRLDSSRLEQENKWFIPAAFDAASASALINAELDSKDKTFEQLKQLLETRINELDKKVSGSKYSFVWVQLYLDHSKYFLASANFYKEKNQVVSATESARNGFSLIYLADSIFALSTRAHDFAESAPQIQNIQQNPDQNNIFGTGEQGIFPISPIMIFVFFGLLLIIAVLALALIRVSTGSAKNDSIEGQLKQTQRMSNELDKALISKKVDNSKYNFLSQKYKSQMDKLIAEKESRSKHILEIDLLRAKVLAYEHALRDLKVHFRDGFVSEQDYKRNLNYYKRQIDLINSELDDEQKKLNSDLIEEGKKPKLAVSKNVAVKTLKKTPVSRKKDKGKS